MKKLIMFICLITLYISDINAVSLKYINLNSIEKIDVYNDEILFLINNQKYINGFMPDEYWNAPFSREDLIEKVEKTYNIIESNPENSNQEYLLLKAAVSEFLYHLNAPNYFQKTVDNYNSINQLETSDYRYIWFLGLFYAKAAKPFEAIQEFKYIFDRIPKEKLHPDLIADYAYVEFLAMMPKSSMSDFEYFYKVTNGDPNDNSLYSALKEKFIDYKVGEEIDFLDLFYPFQREDTSGFLSRLLGLWISTSNDWKMDYTGLKNGRSVVKLTFSANKEEGSPEITYTVMILSFINEENPEKNIISTLPNIQKINLGFSNEYKSYEFNDPNTYVHMGGSHGYITVVKTEYSEDKIVEIEKPAKMINGKNSSGSYYVPLSTNYNRYNGTITHIVLLDTCEDIFKESSAQYVNILKNIDFK